jgi:hypothetical protein
MTPILSVFLDFFNKTWDHVVIWVHIFNNTDSTYFYSEFYVHLLCEFSIVSDYDEMNCNIIFRVFKMYFKV